MRLTFGLWGKPCPVSYYRTLYLIYILSISYPSCIIGELIKRKPLFPGKSHANQVQLILEVKGYRTPADLGVTLTSEASSFLDRRCKFNGQSLSSFIPQASPSAIELLTGLLQLNPALRPTATEALGKSYLADAQLLNDYTNPANQPRQIDETFFDFERNEYSIEALREMIREEVKSYKTRTVASGAVRTGLGATASAPSSLTPPASKHEATLANRQDSGDIQRQFSAGVERSSGPSSQAPTAARGRQMSTNNLGPADDRVAFNKRELEDAQEQDFGELSAERSGNTTQSESTASRAVTGSSAVTNYDASQSTRGSIADNYHRSGSLTDSEAGDGQSYRKSSSRKAPPTPSPGKMQSIAKQERKQKRIFYLQSQQRKKVEEGGDEGPALASTGPQRRGNPTSGHSAGASIRSGGAGFASAENVAGNKNRSRGASAAIPPLPVEAAAAAAATTADNGDLSHLFNQFQSSSFSARERRETLPADNHMVKYGTRQLNTAPDINKNRLNSRFPQLRGSGKLPGRL